MHTLVRLQLSTPIQHPHPQPRHHGHKAGSVSKDEEFLLLALALIFALATFSELSLEGCCFGIVSVEPLTPPKALLRTTTTVTTANPTSYLYPSHPDRTQNGKNAVAGDKDHDWFWLQAGEE